MDWKQFFAGLIAVIALLAVCTGHDGIASAVALGAAAYYFGSIPRYKNELSGRTK